MSVLCEEGLERFWTDAKTYLTGTAVPLMDGTAAVGSSSKFAREDHVHPSDSTKVDKVAGMGLSTNDFTDALKQKLEGLVSYSTMTAAEMEAGTDTTGKLVTAKDLHDTYVNVSGDTMTGNLTIHKSGPLITLRNSNIDVTVHPSSVVYTRPIVLTDKNNVAYGEIQSTQYTDGRIGITMQADRTVNGSFISHAVRLLIADDGTRSVVVSDPAAWRTALDVYSKTESDNRYVNVTGDTMTGTLTLKSGNTRTNLVFNNSGGFTETISQGTAGGLTVTATGSYDLYIGSTRHYYLVTNESYYHHFATTVRFHNAVLHDNVTYHNDNVYIDGHSYYADSNNIATGAAASSTVTGDAGYYGRDKNNKYVGGLRFVAYATNRYGANLFAQNGTVYNQLSLLVDNSGTKTVWVSDPAVWRDALMPVGGVSSLASNTVYYRKIGDFVQVWGNGISCGTTWKTIATLPSGYRPSNRNLYFAGICGGNGNRHMSVSISTSGVISASSSSAATDGYFYVWFIAP